MPADSTELAAALRAARRDVAIALGDTASASTTVDDYLAGIPLLARVRILCPSTVAGRLRCLAEGVVGRSGLAVRATAEPPPGMVLIDRRFAAVNLDPMPGRPSGTLTGAPPLLAFVAEVFDRQWAAARPVCLPWRPPALATNILQALASGMTDSTIARRLDVSPRTVRRHINKLMERVDVHSRFELGVRAVEMGWLAR